MIRDQTAADEYREIAGRFTALVEGVPDEATWKRPGPGRRNGPPATSSATRRVDPRLPRRRRGRHPAAGPASTTTRSAAWRTMSDGVQALLDDPASADRTLRNPHIGEVPLPQAISRFFTADVFMHTWDLARATGQDETLDPERCAVLLDGMQPLDDLLRSSGQYGPKVEVPDDADVQTRMLAFIGRDPR